VDGPREEACPGRGSKMPQAKECSLAR